MEIEMKIDQNIEIGLWEGIIGLLVFMLFVFVLHYVLGPYTLIAVAVFLAISVAGLIVEYKNRAKKHPKEP